MALLPERVDILIVGAGPTGLAAALSLKKHGCKSILVVDNVLAGENTSRAITMHAATLEALEEIGCATRIVDCGIKASGGRLWDGYRFHPVAGFSALKAHTKYPFLLLTPQHVTERILGERAKEQGVDVRRPFKVVDLKVSDSDTSSTDVVFHDGQVVRARFVVGADGARSIVRECAGIRLADPDGDNDSREDLKQAVLADVVFASPPPVGPTELLFILSNGNFFLSIPLPSSSYEGEQVWRIGTGIPMGIPPQSPPLEYLQGVVDAYGPGCIPLSAMPNRAPLKIEKVIWSTRFRTHSAIADTPFARLRGGKGGPVMLIGDAAHLHPPTGGQGMNLGLRDAVFLGQVLADYLPKSEGLTGVEDREELDKVLKTWADWRHAQALKVIALAKGTLSYASWKDEIRWYYGFIPINWVWVRNFFLWLGNITGVARRRAPWVLSGLLNR